MNTLNFTPKKDYFLSPISEPLKIPYLQFKADKEARGQILFKYKLDSKRVWGEVPKSTSPLPNGDVTTSLGRVTLSVSEPSEMSFSPQAGCVV